MMEAPVMQMTMCFGRVSTLLYPTGGGCRFRAGNHLESHDIKSRSCSDRSVQHWCRGCGGNIPL
ncbi:hypothetical protein BO83DRAFT_171414 [Aspergillus eucalypticola CBS 122712]|uniref:Uncharacterized protein n=1 Tax=Aspergillus eucalypticola (strain CBS 122712 / IBT 29274) TaxID=1448314 RepID=A0A317W559_ASPEC|nr:uncharacterized protein BO83DRAFT_171414 [Aspergillus eucalypticola CBS 122712]PWY81189.1 hypothetical protein BO83DRAFT_171414 [Aspergillus eucalypticola CBS 122712]